MTDPTTIAAVAQDPIYNLLVSVGGLLGPFVEDGEPIKRGEARDLLLRIRQARAALAQPRPSDDSQGGVVRDGAGDDLVCLPVIGAVPRGLALHPAVLALQEMAASIGIVNKTACWNHTAMFEVRDALCDLLAATPAATAQAEPYDETLGDADAAEILADIRGNSATIAQGLREYARRVVARSAAPTQEGAQASSRAESLGRVAPKGWKLVPSEPTVPMIDAAFDLFELSPVPGYPDGNALRVAIYKAMFHAAPSAAAERGEG